MNMNRKIINDLGQFIKLRYGVEFQDNIPLMARFVELVAEIDRAALSNYFGWDQTQGQHGGYWTQQLKFQSRRTGQQLVDRINSMPDDIRILDVGCGDNEFKKYFGERLTGIDPYNKRADRADSIETYKPDRLYDVVLALGSINFGDINTIKQQVERVVAMCKPGGKIFWRFNPGITHDHDRAKWIDFFEWTEQHIRDFAAVTNCRVEEIDWEHPVDQEVRWGNRYYSEWTKSLFRTPAK